MPKGSASSYSTGFASGHIDHALNPEGQMKQYKMEEKETHQAPRVLPYEFSNLPQYYANIVDNAITASKILEDLVRDGEWENDPELMKLKNNTDKLIVYFNQTVDDVLDNFTIGDSVDNDE